MPAATKRSTRKSASTAKSREVYDVIVIGASWGGLDALSTLLDGLHDAVRDAVADLGIGIRRIAAERQTLEDVYMEASA